jgi:hypothetical protein
MNTKEIREKLEEITFGTQTHINKDLKESILALCDGFDKLEYKVHRLEGKLMGSR